MTKKKTSKNAELEAVFSHFIQPCKAAFQYLVDDFGFQEPKVDIIPPECTVTYNKAPGSVTITYEYSSRPWVTLWGSSPEDPTRAERYGLDFLIQERCPERSTPTGDYARQPTVMVDTLQTYADVLRTCGSDILKGDFSVFPKLRVLQNRASQQSPKK